ncbi:MAG: hypothetical protein ACM3XP_02145, partial [Nitrososphaerales archaeon]
MSLIERSLLDFKEIKKLVSDSYSSQPQYNEIMTGVPEEYNKIKTLRELLLINYKHPTVDKQIRGNLIRFLRKEENPFKGIIGYEDDVIPAINRAILSGHDILLVGQIGQAKTKLAEAISKNLPSHIPIVRGSITNDIATTIPQPDL